MNLRNRATGRVMPMDTDGKRVPLVAEVFVGPGWVRAGKHVDEPMRDGRERRLTEEQIVERAVVRQARYAHGWQLFWTAVGLLAVAAWVFSEIAKSLQR